VQPALPHRRRGGAGLGGAAAGRGGVCLDRPRALASGAEGLQRRHLRAGGGADGDAELRAADVHLAGRARVAGDADGPVLRGAAGAVPRAAPEEGGDPGGGGRGLLRAGAGRLPLRRARTSATGRTRGGRPTTGGRCGRGWRRLGCAGGGCGTGAPCWRGRARGGSCGGSTGRLFWARHEAAGGRLTIFLSYHLTSLLFVGRAPLLAGGGAPRCEGFGMEARPPITGSAALGLRRRFAVRRRARVRTNGGGSP
jgi:hypothetical protein